MYRRFLVIKRPEREADNRYSSNIKVWNAYARGQIYLFLHFLPWFYIFFFFTSLSLVVEFLKSPVPYIFSSSVFEFKFYGRQNFPSSVFDLLKSPIPQTFSSLIFQFLMSSVTRSRSSSPSFFSAPPRGRKTDLSSEGDSLVPSAMDIFWE
jgi:hypothetical protein